MKDRAQFIIQSFQQLGLRLNPTSRIATQADVYLDRKGTLPQILEPGHELTEIARETLRDLNQIGYALKQLLPVIPREELKKQLYLLMGDNVLPQDSPQHSPGRDKQCELFIAGLCTRAGLKPTFKEPDLQCELPQQTFGVAIKRLKSWDSHKKRVCDAADQINKSGFPGIIIMDVSQALNPTNLRMSMDVTDEQLRVAINTAKNRLKEGKQKQLFEWTRGQGVRGVIFLEHLVRCSPTGVWEMILMSVPINLSELNQRRRREFELFSSRFESAVDDPGPI